ncbi:hypothetical protein GGH15_000692 [Coemansia sp. RSA 562]|nr:hypothetical protein GGH15_000692 [Coemansia sp. RSA 562]KAJ2293349.1 hypothetical protein IW141_001250 [Coemansia sp. RSA 355]
MLTPTRKGSSNIPLPGHFGSNMGLDSGRAASAASQYSDTTRGGRSSSLSFARSATPSSATRLPQIARPSLTVEGVRPSFSIEPAQRTHSRADSTVLGPLSDQNKSRSSSLQSTENEPSAEFAFVEHDDGDRVMPVKVAVRIRPLLSDSSMQLRAQSTSCVSATGSAITVSGSGGSALDGPGGASGPRSFTYDYAFGPDAAQTSVYDAAISPLLGRFVEGYNVTVLAYGQTSSGKTYTMGTDADDIAMLAQPGAGSTNTGIVPRALQWLFAWATTTDGELGAPQLRPGVDVTVSFLEVYNEDLIDLVARTQSHGVGPPIFVREDAKGNILWTGVREVRVSSAADALDLLLRGSRERQTGGTRMNEKSSRSHAIYSISLTQTRLRSSDVDGKPHEPIRLHSKLHFVDLAGSERLKKTHAVGERQREGISINTGLLALGNVISALGDPNKRGPLVHVPYRESKLTYMLRDSLGGNAQTLLIACVSAAEANTAETVNTLQYASRARNIRNRGGVNMVSMSRASPKEVEALRALVRKLKGDVSALTERLHSCEPVRDSQPIGSADLPMRAGSSARVLSSPATPSRIPSMNTAVSTAMQRRAQFAEELNALKTRNMELEAQLENTNDNYTELLLKFNDACRDIEDHQNEGFARDQKLRSREQELRRLTAHSRSESRAVSAFGEAESRPTSVADTLRRRRSEMSTCETETDSPQSVPDLPDLSRLNSLRSSTVSSRPARNDGPGADEFDAILEEYDTSVRSLEDELKSSQSAVEALRVQLSMQESKATFGERLAESQQSQIETLRLQIGKAREAGEEEEQKRRAVEAELEDAQFNAETQMEAVVGEWRLELQGVDEQWNERWAAAQAEHQSEVDGLRVEYQNEIDRQRTEHQNEMESVRSEMEGEMDQQRAELETEMELQRTELEADMDQQRAEMQAELDQQRVELDQQKAELDQQKAELDQKHTNQTIVHPNVQSELQSELTQLTRQHAKLESELVEQRAEFEAELTRLIQQRSEYEAELTEQRAELEQSTSEYRAQIAEQQAEIARLTAIPSARPDVSNEVHTLRLRALDAEARALSAEEALAVLSDTAAAPATSALSPAEKRLREMRGYRHSTVLQKIAEPVTPSDKFASYPELQLAASPPARSSPVFDADQVHIMLRDAAVDAERQALFDRERRALQAKIAELRETKKELQGHNSQFKNLMRDLGEKLVGLAQENDALEAKAGDRDELAAEVTKLTLVVDELQARLADASERVEKAGAERASVSLRSASDTLDSPVHVMQSKLQSIESEMAAHVDRACQAEEQRDLYCTELHRARADLRRLSVKAEEQKEEHDRRKHRFSRLLCLV